MRYSIGEFLKFRAFSLLYMCFIIMVEIRISMFCLFGLLSVSFVEKTARERLTRGERLRGGKLCLIKEREFES